MKITKFIAGIFSAAVLFAGCQGGEIMDADTFEVVAENADGGVITLAKEGASVTIKVKSSFDWVVRGVEESSDWLSVSVDGTALASDKDVIKASASEKTVTIEAAENTGKDRSVSLTVFASALKKAVVTIKQAGEQGDGTKNATVAEVIAEASTSTIYRLSGTVSSFNSTYCSFDLTDETGSIYVYSVTSDSKTKYATVIKNGGKVTISGNYKYFETKSQHEIVDATIESYEAGEQGDPDKAVECTVADFISKADKINYYILSGTVSGFNPTYCSFNLADSTGTIYVYSVAAASKTEWSSKIANGGSIVIKAQYEYYASKSQHEAVNAIIVSYEEGKAETLSVEGLVVATSKVGFLVKTSEGIVYAYDTDLTVDVKVGQVIKLKGEKTSYNGVDEIENYTVEVVSSDNAVEHPEATALDAAGMDSYNTIFGYVSMTGKLSVSGNYYNIVVPDANVKGSLANPVAVADSLNGKYVDVKGYVVGSSTQYLTVMYTDIAMSAEQPEEETIKAYVSFYYPDELKESVNNYSSTWKAQIGSMTWSLVNFNNNSAKWSLVKCGHSKNPYVATISTTTAMPVAISQVAVTFDSFAADKVNKSKLYVSANADFSEATEVAFTGKAGVVKIDVASPAANAYYKLEFDCAVGSSNGFVAISRIDYIAAAAE